MFFYLSSGNNSLGNKIPPQQQVGNYGAAYLATMSFWAYILDGTSLALDQERFKLITNYTNEGVRRILWKNKMDVNNLGRQLYRQAQRNKAFSSLFSANALAQVNSKDCNVYHMLIDENLGNTSTALLGQRWIVISDFQKWYCPNNAVDVFPRFSSINI